MAAEREHMQMFKMGERKQRPQKTTGGCFALKSLKSKKLSIKLRVTIRDSEVRLLGGALGQTKSCKLKEINSRFQSFG